MLRRRLIPMAARAAAFAFFLAVAVIVLPGTSNADGCTVPPGELVPVENPRPGESDYRVVCPGDDGDDGGRNDGGGLSCDLSLAERNYDATYWCEGELACFAHIPSALYPDPEDWPSEPPTPTSVYIFKQCIAPDGTMGPGVWQFLDLAELDQPTPEQLALEAFGRLTVPDFSLAFNPPTRSYVTIDTWWWAEGAGAGDITGSAAFGVVAIGEPDFIEVDPGDGSGSFECPWTVTQSDACTYTYDRASVNGTAVAADGSPAYPAQARLVYSVRFEQNGSPLDLPGLPDSLEGPWVSTPVPVAEIQATVIG